ncbi:MAG TPA: hypothetical protein DG753_00570 [Clostridium sp.]|nr:hypothetical protein [Clostridium sp.]
MARAIGYCGTLGADYELCEEVIKELSNAIESAKQDKSDLEKAFGFAEGCDGIGDAIPSAIKIVDDRIERMTSFKDTFEKYIEKIKSFDNEFASGFSFSSLNVTLRAVGNLTGCNFEYAAQIGKLNKMTKKYTFYKIMRDCYGFSNDDAQLILTAYDAAMSNTSYLTNEETLAMMNSQLGKYELTDTDRIRDFLTNLCSLSVYNNFQWNLVASSPSADEAKKYFKGIGLNDDEITRLTNIIEHQHTPDTPGKKDFAHEMVEIAAYLNEYGSLGRLVIDAGSFGQTDQMASMKGDIWSGSMSDSDMISNIDSMNLFNRALKNKDTDFLDLFVDYNKSVLDGKINRAEEYCANYGGGDVEKGKQRIKDITESWTPVAEYDTGRPQITIQYVIDQFKKGLALDAYMKSDPGLNYTHDQVEDIVNDMNKDTKNYKDDITDMNNQIEGAKKQLYEYLEIN